MSEKKARRKILPRVAMPEQPAEARARNFEEVALGYTRADALAEAARCLQCKNPKCRTGCPVEIDIKGFIARLQADDLNGAYEVIRDYNSLPAVCGRVCPQETQCEGACVLSKTGQPVAIGRLERYVADTFAASGACEQITGRRECTLEREYRVACVGGGPASLSCAGYLAALGVKVTVFEALHEVGGVLVYGIPRFRLPKSVVRREVEAMQALGVEFVTNWVGGRTFQLQELLDQGYDAVFLGVGAGLPRFLEVPGENLLGVYSANEYLTRVNLGRAYAFPDHDTPPPHIGKVVVVGGGNVAMDAARTALRLGAEEVTVLYRRTESEMPARLEEVHHAKEEGVRFKCLCSPISFNGDEKMQLTSVTAQLMQLGEPDDSGRCRPVCVPGASEEIKADTAVIAVGTRPNPILLEATPELELNRWGYIQADPETGRTSMPRVFAGGDIVTGAATVISAMGAGRRSAKAIAKELLG
ncbi:MAG: NADPH-dependent glutamate synthase [Desulfovibrionaceae bacterium]